MAFQKVREPSGGTIMPTVSSVDSYGRCQIRFLGGKLGKALAEEYDVSTVGDLLYVLSPFPFTTLISQHR